MPAGQGEDAERFAAAVEQGTPPGFADDDDLARELEIVAMLRSSGSAFAPDPETKARAKQRLMAMFAAEHAQHADQGRHAAVADSIPRPPVAPPTPEETTAPIGRVLEPSFPSPRTEIDTSSEKTTIVPAAPRQRAAEDQIDDNAATSPRTVKSSSPTSPTARLGHRSRHSVASRPAGRARGVRRPVPGMRRRVVLVGSAALLAMIALTGGGLFASRDALPGDTLYALKRAGESAEIALTFDETAKAQRHLEIATTRLSEVEQLVARDTQVTNPEVFSSAMEGFDSAAGEGSSMLIAAAEKNDDTPALDSLHTWVTEQAARLSELRPVLPTSAAAEADGSIQLLDVLRGRTEALGAGPVCSALTSSPVRAEGDCTPRSANQQGSGSRGAGSSEAPASSGREPAPSGAGTPSGTPSVPTTSSDPLLPLPDLSTNRSQSESQDGKSNGNGSTRESDTPAPGGAGGGVSVPLPLVPPITLPPLVPGMPPITIG